MTGPDPDFWIERDAVEGPTPGPADDEFWNFNPPEEDE